MNMNKAANVAAIVILTLIILIIVCQVSLLFGKTKEETSEILAWGINITFVVCFVIIVISLFSGSEEHEYGLFGRKKKKVEEPKQRMTYGNPMKSQDYTPRSGIKTTPKTDSSKIYKQYN